MGKVNVYLPDALEREIEDKTRRSDLKKSQIVQRALRQYFNQTENGETDIQFVSERQEDLEGEVTEVRKVQNAILKKMGWKVKPEEELEDLEETVELIEEDEEEDEE